MSMRAGRAKRRRRRNERKSWVVISLEPSSFVIEPVVQIRRTRHVCRVRYWSLCRPWQLLPPLWIYRGRVFRLHVEAERYAALRALGGGLDFRILGSTTPFGFVLDRGPLDRALLDGISV